MKTSQLNNGNIEDLISKALEDNPTSKPVINKDNIEDNNNGLTPLLYVESFFKKYKIGYTKASVLCMNKDENQGLEAIKHQLILDYGDFKRKNYSAAKFSNQELEAALSVAIANLSKKMFEAVRKTLKYDKTIDPDFSELKKYLKACNKNFNELDLAIHQQFILNTKRKIHKKEAKYHIFPIYYGPQGTGKTESIKKFLAPLYHLSTMTNFSAINDKFSYELFQNSYVLFLDELEKAEKTSIERIKNTVSSNYINARVPFTAKQITVANNSSYIGCSNKPVNEAINDQTGMRRFYEFSIPEKVDWELLNEVDFVKIWQSIDPEAEDYTPALYDQLAKHQEELRTKSIYEQFVEAKELERGEVKVSAAKLYEVFGEFCERNNLNKPSQAFFGRKMTNLFEKVRTGQGQVYMLNYEPSLHDPAISGELLSPAEEKIRHIRKLEASNG